MSKEKNLLEELLKKKGRKARNDYSNVNHSKSSNNNNKPKKLSTSNEVVVKVLNGGNFKGHGHTKNSLANCLHYLIRGSEDQQISNLFGKTYTAETINEAIDEATADFIESPDYYKQKNRLFTHLGISIPNNIETKAYNQEKLKVILHNVTIEAVNELFPHHNFFIGIHDNGNNLHAHVPILCKSNLDGKKLRINKPEIQELREKLVVKFKDYNINLKATDFLNKERVKKSKIKKVHVNNNFKVGEVYNKKVPNWVKEQAVLDNKDTKLKSLITIQGKSFKELESLFNKGYKEKNKALTSFLLMYKENESLAKWTLKNKPKIFGILKDNANKDLFKEINFSRVITNDKRVNKKISSIR